MANETPAQRDQWSGKWAFILAAAGSAVGLGNLWRFPYLTAKYGGGTFLFVYLLGVVCIGLPLLLQDLSLGRYTRQSAIGAFASAGKRYRFLGLLASIVPFLILPYYCIIGGWVTKYFVAYIGAHPAAIADGGSYFSNFIGSNVESFVFAGIFAALIAFVILRGVKGGIEKVNLVLMPVLIIMAAGIAIYTLSMPGAIQGVAFYLLPDLSKISPELILAALGQCFFSMSIAMAIMITYGSYLDSKEDLVATTCRIGVFDVLISLLAGLMIIPGAFVALGSADAVSAASGPGLMFVTLPSVFLDMGVAAKFIGILFFLLAFFAALTSAISIAEACVSILCDSLGFIRRRATIILLLYVVVVGAFVNSGYNLLSFLQPLGANTTLLDLFDFLANSVLMPLVCLGTCIFVGWVIKPKTLVDEVRQSSPFKLAGAWSFIIKYICPVVVLAVLASCIATQLGLLTL